MTDTDVKLQQEQSIWWW